MSQHPGRHFARRAARFFCLLAGLGSSCARSVTSPAGPAVPSAARESTWQRCAVASALARQFTHALALLGEMDSFVDDGRIMFRVCDANGPECNHFPQPFPGACPDQFFVARLSKRIDTTWSTETTPSERAASYVPVLIGRRDNDITAEVDLHYRLSGSPAVPVGSASRVFAGVTASRGDAPTIRVVIAGDGSQTRDSVILIGERMIAP